MTPNQQKEEISKAYVQAVAAINGYKIATWSVDDGCLDLTISTEGVLGGGTYAAPKVDVQLKCTSQNVTGATFVSWKLKRSHYEKLIRQARIPHLLVVLVLPKKKTDWVVHS